MTDGMKYCLATGNWGDRKNPSKAGVVQVQIIAICEYVCMSLRMCMCIFARIYILYRCMYFYVVKYSHSKYFLRNVPLAFKMTRMVIDRRMLLTGNFLLFSSLSPSTGA